MDTPTHRYHTWLGMLLVTAVFFVLVVWFFKTYYPPATLPITIVETPLRTSPSQVPLTQMRTIEAIDTKTFSLLLSYVATGFEPKQATIHAGDMVRFANNSTGMMLIVMDSGASPLPHMTTVLTPGEYWEYTFASTGTYTFHEQSHPDQTGIIRVQ